MLHAEGRAEFAMRQFGFLRPTVFGFRTGSPFVCVRSRLPEEAKEGFSAMVRLNCMACAATTTVLAIEGWARAPQPGETFDPGERISEAFDRREVVLLSGEAKDRRMDKILPIIRTDAGGFFGFGETNPPSTETASGCFTNLLPPKTPTNREQHRAMARLKALGAVIE